MTSRHRGDPEDGLEEQEELQAGDVARPFMADLPPTPPAGLPGMSGMPGSAPGATGDTASQDDADVDVDTETVRPYFVTGGRVHEGLGDFGKVYVLTASGAGGLDALTFERRQIAELCRTPQSVAELSALLDIPLGVATVLTRDLARDGLLGAGEAPQDPASDLALITRLIHAVQAL